MPTSDYTPTSDEVAALLRSRTVNQAGAEVGVFNDETRPTYTEVVSLINQGVRDVRLRIGADIPNIGEIWEGARAMAALRTAMYVELNYFPEQIPTGRSPYNEYKDLWDEMMAYLEEAVQSAEANTGEEDTTLSTGMAKFSFPPNQGGLIGWGTRW